MRHRHVDGDDGDVEHDVDVVDDVGVEHDVGDVDAGDADAENTDGLLDVEHDVEDDVGVDVANVDGHVDVEHDVEDEVGTFKGFGGLRSNSGNQQQRSGSTLLNTGATQRKWTHGRLCSFL